MEPTDLTEPGPGRAAGARFAALDALAEATVVLAPLRCGAAVVDFVFDYANAAAAEALGVAAGELSGRRLLEMLPGIQRELLRRLIDVVEGGRPLHAQLDYRDAFAGRPALDGRFAVSASRLGGRLLAVYEDVTARERALAAERRFGAVIEATSDWVSIADADERLVYVNAGGRRMIGIGPDEDIAGLPVGRFSPAWARERVLREALPVARRDGVWRGDLARQHRDGHEV